MDGHRNRVINQEAAELIARRFQALSDSTRLRILGQLTLQEEASVRELTEALQTSHQNVSRHLSALYAEGFVARRKVGTSTIYRISDPAVLDVCERMCEGIETQLEKLGEALGSQE